MSHWTHIVSCISLDTGIEEKEEDLIKAVKECLSKAPKITGSEADADIFVNVLSGYNTSIYGDCDHCPYKDTLVDLGDSYECAAPKGSHCPDNKYQTCIIISIQGDLRDRLPEQTQKEFDKFLKYIENNFPYIDNYTVNIEGE